MSNFGERLTGYFGGSGGGGGTPVPPNPTSSFLPYNNSGSFDDSHWCTKLPTATTYTTLIAGDSTSGFGFSVEGNDIVVGDFNLSVKGVFFQVNSTGFIRTKMNTVVGEFFGFNTNATISSFGDFEGDFNSTKLEIGQNLITAYSTIGANGFSFNIASGYSTTKFGDFSGNFIFLNSNGTQSWINTQINGQDKGLAIDPDGGLLSPAGYYLGDFLNGLYIYIGTSNDLIYSYYNSAGNGFYFDYTNFTYYYGDYPNGYFFATKYNSGTGEWSFYTSLFVNQGIRALNSDGSVSTARYVSIGDYDNLYNGSYINVDDEDQYLVIGENLFDTISAPSSTGDYLKINVVGIGDLYLELFQ
jgi:hypothetical protein